MKADTKPGILPGQLHRLVDAATSASRADYVLFYAGLGDKIVERGVNIARPNFDDLALAFCWWQLERRRALTIAVATKIERQNV